MAAAQEGDQASYARLLSELTVFLRRLARQEWPRGNAADIEDVVQETLLTLHVSLHTFDPSRPFIPWLLTLLKRRAVDGVRRRVRIHRNEIAADTLEVTFLVEPANIAAEAPGDGEALRKAIARLPPGQRQAIELLKLQELSLKQASVATGLSVAALKVATHRALTTLRHALAEAK
jgi:RNA polymerase sigma-70 factor (ECF subfamily)